MTTETTHKEPLSYITKGYRIFADAFYENSGPLMLCGVAIVATPIFFSAATVPLLLGGVTFYATKVVCKIGDEKLKNLINQTTDLSKTYPYLEVALIVVTLGLSILSPTLGSITAVGTGLFIGLTKTRVKAYNPLKPSNTTFF